MIETHRLMFNLINYVISEQDGALHALVQIYMVNFVKILFEICYEKEHKMHSLKFDLKKNIYE